MHSRGMVVLAPWIDQCTLLQKESAITTVFREVHGERAAPWVFNILDQHRSPGPAPLSVKKREIINVSLWTCRLGTLSISLLLPLPSPRHSFGKTKIKKGRGRNFVRTMYSYWHLHGCRGVVPDKTTHIPCSRARRILFTTENTSPTIHHFHFPCSFEIVCLFV